MDTKMSWLRVISVCLLALLPSVLNLPLVPKQVLNLEEQPPSASETSASKLLINKGQTTSLNSGNIHNSVNVQNLHAQSMPNLPEDSVSKRDPQSSKTQREISQNQPTNSQSLNLSQSDTLKYEPQTNSKTPQVLNPINKSSYTVLADNPTNLQLAVNSDFKTKGQGHSSEMILTVGVGLAALFSLGLAIGVFACCCPKKATTDDVELKAEKPITDDKQMPETKKPSQVFNTSDLPPGEEDLDQEPVSFKDKVKALDDKLIIQLSPDKRKSQQIEPLTKRRSQLSPDQAGNRLSQHSPDASSKRKSHHENNDIIRQPKITVSDDDARGDNSRSTADNISKSDTQDDISDKIFDNISTHSSLSQPYNPDVVIAGSDEDEEFAEIQRGTTILKSFQRAKPPRNRSPATRTSKGKIRKSRPNLNSPSRTPGSTPSSASQPVSMATESKTNSVDRSECKPSRKESLDTGVSNTDKPGVSNIDKGGGGSKTSSLDKKHDVDKKSDIMSKSSDFSDIDSLMSQSVTSIGSDNVTPMKRNGKYAKNKKDSPLRERNQSPARSLKGKDEATKDTRNESPSRYRKNSKESPVSKRKHRHYDTEVRGNNRLSTDVSDKKDSTNANGNRLSGVGGAASNNIFYLIDPTVKNKCKSVGDVAAAHRKSADFSKDVHKV